MQIAQIIATSAHHFTLVKLNVIYKPVPLCQALVDILTIPLRSPNLPLLNSCASSTNFVTSLLIVFLDH